MPLEEWNDRPQQLAPLSHDVAIQVLAVVVVSPIGDHLTHPEELSELVETRDALRALRHRELVSHLVAGPVAGSARATRLADEADREAAFSVYKTNNPAFLPQPFLLVFRTARIFTVHILSMGRVPDGYSGFPAYSRMRSALLPMRWATNLP